MVHANRSILPMASIDPRRWWALAVLAAAQFMIVLDATIVNVGLAAIQRALAFSPDDLTWVVNAYVLAFGSLLLLGGRIGDRLGRRADRRPTRPADGLHDRSGSVRDRVARLRSGRVGSGPDRRARRPGAGRGADRTDGPCPDPRHVPGHS